MEPTGDQSTLTMSACRESASLIAFFAPTAMAATASVLSPCGHKRLYLVYFDLRPFVALEQMQA